MQSSADRLDSLPILLRDQPSEGQYSVAFVNFLKDCIRARTEDARRYSFLTVLDICFIALFLTFAFTDGVVQSVGLWALLVCGYVEIVVLAQRIKSGPMRQVVASYPNLSFATGLLLSGGWALFATAEIMLLGIEISGSFGYIGAIFTIGAWVWVAVPLFHQWREIDRGRNRLCNNCGYDRKGDLWTPCPECGYAEEERVERVT